ncbi:unnamed protein product [Trifolium pratense]|uniref:Uncharacterized protein n=1 Tax=Trifolium pratense TaxID=57577 RepID=A0ACB0MA67_TRIPR|nr:unnamed protein product [Trifolium pratense]
MPKNSSQIQLIRGMDEKIASLEAEMSGMKITLANMEQNQAKLIAMFEKSLGKSIPTVEERVEEIATKITEEPSEPRPEQSSTNHLSGEALAEFRRSVKKVELPLFDGEDPAGWISRAEIYFRVQETRPEVKVNLAQLCMEGPTIHFFNSLLNENEDLTWGRLTEALLERYVGHGEGDVYEQLTELRQRGNVEEYINDFEYLTAQIPRLPEKQFLGYFLHGLKEEIRGKVRSLTVVGDLSRSKVLQVARAVEKEMKKDFGAGYNKPYKSGYGSNRPGSQNGDWVFVKAKDSGPKNNSSGPRQDRPAQYDRKKNTARDRGFTQLSYNEIMERRKKGLCFKCGGAFHPMHHESSSSMNIKLGDGSISKTQGTCKGLGIDMEGLKVVVDVQLFELGCVDVVLGMEWLRTLGDMIVNWKKHTMSFWFNKEWVTVRGMDAQLSIMETLQSVLCKPKGSVAAGWREGNKVNCGVFHTLEVGQSRELEHLLNLCADVFQDPTGLPPKREKEHVITLKEGAGAISVRPYRYPHHHKDEIEKQVKEMLSTGVIRPSTSAFSSPVILVKKKDSSWRMCIDYRALNKATVPDKFPIPVIEELLDELHGAIYSKTWAEHLKHLEEVLKVLQKHKLVANKKKCQFGQNSVDYLGHLITELGVAVDPDKVISVTNWPVPKNVKGVRGFLGLTGYYRKFIKDYGKIAKPLTELTKKDAFMWSDKAQKAFDALKICLTTAPVLALPDFSKNFTIECDASGGGIGAILMQEQRPVAYYSKALGVRNLTKSAYEKELMAVVLAIQHWRPYLIGRRFVVSTDQKSLKQLLQQRMVSADQQNWAAKLLGYDFDIVYKPGKLNRGADALSRVGVGELCQGISSVKWNDEEIVKAENKLDPQLQQIIEELQLDVHSRPGYVLKHGVLLYQGRLVLSAKSSLIPLLLAEFHETPQGGHSGFYRTYRRIAANVYWIGMKNTIQEFVRACDVCQRQKHLTSSPGGLLQPLPIPDRIWEDLSMDFVTGLPKSKGYEAILVVVDRLSKYVHFVPLKHPYTARTIAEVFVREIVRLHGIPLSIVSDRGPVFVSNFWRELFKLQGTKLRMSTAYHPETDGQTEVVNRCLETYLRCFITDQPKTWSNWISWAEYWFNTSYHATTGQTPYEIVYGRAPPVITRWVQGETRVDAVQKELLDRDEALRQLRDQLQRAQDRMKQIADKKRCDRSFEVGEWVFVKLRAHRQQSVVCRINAKLAARYFGPYPVVERVGAVAYRLRLPAGSRVHPVFHVSLLKKAVGTYQEEDELPELEGEQGTLIEPEEVLARRSVQVQNEMVDQILIHWKGQRIEEATWEDVVMIRSQFPNFCLEDKTILSGGKYSGAVES